MSNTKTEGERWPHRMSSAEKEKKMVSFCWPKENGKNFHFQRFVGAAVSSRTSPWKKATVLRVGLDVYGDFFGFVWCFCPERFELLLSRLRFAVFFYVASTCTLKHKAPTKKKQIPPAHSIKTQFLLGTTASNNDISFDNFAMARVFSHEVPGTEVALFLVGHL